MHAHTKDVARRFAREGFLSITFEPYAREGGVAHLPDITAVRKAADGVPDERVLNDLDALMAYALSRYKNFRRTSSTLKKVPVRSTWWTSSTILAFSGVGVPVFFPRSTTSPFR